MEDGRASAFLGRGGRWKRGCGREDGEKEDAERRTIGTVFS
jgi:hypothetical protein